MINSEPGGRDLTTGPCQQTSTLHKITRLGSAILKRACAMDQLVLEAISVSLVLCVASMSKGARKTTSPTHGSNYDARTSLPTHTQNYLNDDDSNSVI